MRQLLPALILLAAIAAWSAAGLADEGLPYVVVVSIDGLKPEAYTKPDAAAPVPTLRRLAERGAFASGVIGVFPTVTYPSHTTLITGVPPAVHGIYNNRFLDPENRSNGAWYWYARDITAPTLVGAVRARGLRAAAINWPVTVGMDADFVVPEFARSQHPESLELLRALSKPATILEDVEAARGRTLPWPLGDAARAEIAGWVMRVHRPHLLLLHLTDTDTAQHDSGPGSPEAFAAIVDADANVKNLVDAIDAAGLHDRTDVVIVSDHGFASTAQQVHLNAAFKEEGWLRTDARGRVSDWDVYFQGSGGSGFVFVKEGSPDTLRQRVWHRLEDIAQDPANGIERVFSTEDLRTMGADPRATFAVDMRQGFYTGGGVERLLTTTTAKGGHGHSPSRPEVHASLIMAGPNVPPAGNLGIVRMTQIGPTVASWFGVSLSPKADRPIALAPVLQH